LTYDLTSPTGQVRLLINDTSDDPAFSDGELLGFLALESQNVKRAAAQAIDTIADDEALTAKVVTAEGLSTNGPAVAAALRARAASLREQAIDPNLSTDEGFFEIIPMNECWWPV